MTLRRRWAALLSAVAVAVAVTVAVVPSTPAAAAEIGPLQVINYNSGQRLDVKERSTSNGATIHQWTCLRQPNQLWWFHQQPPGNGNFFDIQPQHMILRDPPGCVTNPGWSRTPGKDMKIYGCTQPPLADSSQGFSTTFVNGSPLPTPGWQYRYRLINWFSQMCLEIENGSTSLAATCSRRPATAAPSSSGSSCIRRRMK